MRREIKRKMQKEINVNRGIKRVKNEKKIVYFQNVIHSCLSCKVNGIFGCIGCIFSCPEVAYCLINIRQNIVLINVSFPIVTLNMSLANRNIFSCGSS